MSYQGRGVSKRPSAKTMASLEQTHITEHFLNGDVTVFPMTRHVGAAGCQPAAFTYKAAV